MKKVFKISWIMTFIVIIGFAFLTCATTYTPVAPKMPREIIFSNAPDEETAYLYIPQSGHIEVYEFNGIPLGEKWYQPVITQPSMVVKIPAGQNTIRFHYYGGGGADARNLKLDMNIVAGRIYFLSVNETNPGRIGFNQVVYLLYETQFGWLAPNQLREPGPDEQKVYIFGGHLHIIDKNTPEERRIITIGDKDAYINVPKGNHTIEVGLTDNVIRNWGSEIIATSDSIRSFNVSSEPVRLLVDLTSTGRPRNVKFQYTIK